MKKYLTIACLILAGSSLFAQTTKESILTLQPPQDFKNIQIMKLAEDSLSTANLIWIKKEVQAHKHVTHSENIYILEGEGTLRIDGKSYPFKAGDYFFIPKNTPHSVKVKEGSPVKLLSVQSPHFDGKDRELVEEK